MHQIIEEIKERISKYDDVATYFGENYASVKPLHPNSFEVRIDVTPECFIISFEGWHEEFENYDEALENFAFGLSNQCRLKVSIRGNTEYRWELESLDKNTWMFEAETGLFFFPFWRKKKIKYLQNSLIKSNE